MRKQGARDYTARKEVNKDSSDTNKSKLATALGLASSKSSAAKKDWRFKQAVRLYNSIAQMADLEQDEVKLNEHYQKLQKRLEVINSSKEQLSGDPQELFLLILQNLNMRKL